MAGEAVSVGEVKPRVLRRVKTGEPLHSSRAPAQGGGQPAETAESAAGAAPQQGQGPPPRKPRRQPPKPQLSQAALAGSTPLGTFAELAAYWEARKPGKGQESGGRGQESGKEPPPQEQPPEGQQSPPPSEQ